MAITANIKDENGQGLKIGTDGEIPVVLHQHPPLDESTIVLPYRSYFENAGSNDMIVDGSSVPVSFCVDSSPDFDIWIKSISVVIGDAGTPTLAKFGTLSALSTGVSWVYSTQAKGEYTLHDGIKTNLEFIRLGSDTAAIGTGADSFLADVQGGGAEKSYLPSIDMADTFGMPFGLKLGKETNDKLIFRVNDALAGLVTFNAIAYGIRI